MDRGGGKIKKQRRKTPKLQTKKKENEKAPLTNYIAMLFHLGSSIHTFTISVQLLLITDDLDLQGRTQSKNYYSKDEQAMTSKDKKKKIEE